MRTFEELQTIEAVDSFITSHVLSFVYISRTGCSVCHALLPQVGELMEKFPEIRLAHVNSAEVEEVAERFTVFSVPALLLFVEGKEYLREARAVHMSLFEEKLQKIYEGYMN
ncbi:thiol-disulfide isomerase/thioredoxin [Bacillus oleivorans]|uniref:Thiol-disulfide isomerase/thioredoxin n=1 Tax=Bacillus oleivorans TaxID=1448271 RepID=A0A285D6Z4_9BACI|nr:thioredoxin family protein [Bacillus oleivorans]SNX75116.1 thiol-disulfide isomerase/thioredoxin [Bacillus oleivorans]